MIIQAERAVTEGKLTDSLWLEVSNGLITSINHGKYPSPDQSVPGTLNSGFIDIHCHGGSGAYFSNSAKAPDVIAGHRAHGTTGVIASLVTEDIEVLKRQINTLVPLH